MFRALLCGVSSVFGYHDAGILRFNSALDRARVGFVLSVWALMLLRWINPLHRQARSGRG